MAYIAPERYHNPHFRVRSAFLMSRWTPTKWWFAVVVMLRNLLIALVPLMAPTDGGIQLALAGAISVIYLSIQSAMDPWKVSSISNMDSVTNACIALICLFVLGMGAIPIAANEIEERATQYSWMAVIALVVAVACPIVGSAEILMRQKVAGTKMDNSDTILQLLRFSIQQMTENQGDIRSDIVCNMTAGEMRTLKDHLGIFVSEVYGTKLPDVKIPPRLSMRDSGKVQDQAASS